MSVVENISIPAGAEGTTIKIGIAPSVVTGGSLAIDDDYFVVAKTLTVSPYSTKNGVEMGVGVAGKLAGTGTVTVTLGVGDVTSGEFNIIVAYYES